jgi:hypothetical protein
MVTAIRRTLLSSIASLAIGVAAVGMSTPASAQFRHHGGGGGFHGGGFHHGGGFGGRGFGFGLGLGALGLAGAYGAYGAYGGYPYYGDYGYGDGYGYGYDSGCMTYRPVYDRYGNYRGRRLVDVCQ